MADKVTVYIWVPEEIRRKLRVCAAEKGAKLSTIATQAFEQYLARYDREKKKRDVVVPLLEEGA